MCFWFIYFFVVSFSLKIYGMIRINIVWYPYMKNKKRDRERYREYHTQQIRRNVIRNGKNWNLQMEQMCTISAYQITHSIPCVSFRIYHVFLSLFLTGLWLKTTFIFQKIINHVVARLWFFSFSQKTPLFFRHPTMQSLIDIFSWSHSLTFHFISHLFFCSHSIFFLIFFFIHSFIHLA